MSAWLAGDSDHRQGVHDENFVTIQEYAHIESLKAVHTLPSRISRQDDPFCSALFCSAWLADVVTPWLLNPSLTALCHYFYLQSQF